MMAIMEGDNEEVPKEFLETGRTGRRNALPDILQQQEAQASTADLPARLQQLATTGTDHHRIILIIEAFAHDHVLCKCKLRRELMSVYAASAWS